jgi:hypothetical protein
MRLVALALVLALVGLVLPLAACATLPESSGAPAVLPNAGAGPFGALTMGQVGLDLIAPNVVTDIRGYGRDIAVVDLDGDPGTFAVAGFVAASVTVNGVDPTNTSPTRVINRYSAADGRSFDDLSTTAVLTADAAWEGDLMAAPSALRVSGEMFLYYAAAGGIGLARGRGDGTSFTKVPGPVLGPAPGTWEAGAVPSSPGVVQLDDGSFRMFYEVALPGSGTAVGEARSADGLAWTRLGTGPALAPTGTAASDAGAAPYDAAAVGGPFPILATSAEGRRILRVYYGAVDATGTKTIGLAARYGDDGPLQRAVGPVFGTASPLGPSEPCVVAFTGFALLFATERSATTDPDPAVAAAVAPATAALPPPSPTR